MRDWVDILVIGGGINGVGIAADAAGRGLQVCLCEQADLASFTSSWSTKLIHGGLRYLEQYEFHLVREALRERQILLHRAPFMVKPQRFILPHVPTSRPVWMIRMGLWLYDHMAKMGSLHRSKMLRFAIGEEKNPLLDDYVKGFEYMDCRVDDARLVVLNAILAREKGAKILTRTRVCSAVPIEGGWSVTIRNELTGEMMPQRARVVVNATGPWVQEMGRELIGEEMAAHCRGVKGSHLLLPRFYSGDQAYILQQPDGRIVFAIPYLDEYTLVGTTDEEYRGDLYHPKMSDDERDYLLSAINRYFKCKHSADDIAWSFAGVRPLFDDHAQKASKITREYHLVCNEMKNGSVMLHVFGGKLTTYRSLSEHVLLQLKPFLPQFGQSWTADTELPGGSAQDDACMLDFLQRYAELPEDLLHRYWRSYGDRALIFLEGVSSIADLGKHFAAGLYSREVDYLLSEEWAVSMEDILWRRTKLGLKFSAEQVHELENYVSQFRG